MSLDSSDSESSSSETDDSDSESDGSSDTDSDTEGEDFCAIEKEPVRAKQKGRTMHIYMCTVYMLLKKARHHHNQFF